MERTKAECDRMPVLRITGPVLEFQDERCRPGWERPDL